jgi:DNA/RNA-binding domain of Phe-tRNA-synthetase-like protein
MFMISDACIELGLRAGAIAFRNVRIGARPPELTAAIAAEVQTFRSRYASAAEIGTVPEVTWFRRLLEKVGVNTRRELPSLERLLAFALKRGDLPAINSLVDAYNLVSVRSGCSLGAHDLDRILMPVSLRLLTGQETLTPLGKNVPASVTAGEYAYVDAAGRVLCRLDVLQAEFSKVTRETANVLLIVEATAEHPPETLRQAMADSIEIITRHCGGTAEVLEHPEP